MHLIHIHLIIVAVPMEVQIHGLRGPLQNLLPPS
jgi:hypothetical protein